MHRALQIQEILLHIFSYCYAIKPRRAFRPHERYANGHLAALARTCKTFKDPALNMIWAALDDLTPLIRCLPHTTWVKSEGAYSLQRQLETNEWDIVLGYAFRVQSLPDLRGSSGLTAGSIKALSNPPTPVKSIFPNLRIVGLRESSATMVPLVRHLAPPELTRITFEHTENLGVAIEAFTGCPIVTDFCVWQWAHADTISGLICCWKNLRSVRCFDVGLNTNALSHLASLHNLLYMCFKVHDAVVDQFCITQSSASTLSFTALHDICFTSDSLSPIWRLVRRLHSPAVHDLSVHLVVSPTARDLMAFFAALQEAFTHDSLNKLSLHIYYPESGVNFRETSPYYITFDRLRSLTVFVNIKSIILDIACGVDLNERELLCLASSWPYLEKFEVGKDYDWKESSAITPGGFIQLLERCRSLRVLYFLFDTRGYTEIPQGHPWRGLTMPQDTYLNFLHSPIEEESIEALGVFFHVAPYPSFSLSTHWNYPQTRGSQRPPELCDLYYDRWVKARTLAHDLWEKRRDLRHSLEHQSSWRPSQ